MISVVLPTYNEATNIVSLLEAIDGVLRDIPHEIIVVDDDSPDKTWKVATEFSTRRHSIKVLRRIGKKGLSSAVMDGFDAAHGQVLAVMDADGQHDAELLVRLLSEVDRGAGIAIGSRYVQGGSVGDWVRGRRLISNVGTVLAQKLSRLPVSDPLGGFFAIRADLYKKIRTSLRPSGFKILFEILANLPSTTSFVEVPLVFRMRLHGQSKLTLAVNVAFAYQVLRLTFSRGKRSSYSLGFGLFALCTIVTAFTVVPRAFALRLLLTDSSVRTAAQTSLMSVADKQGWLMSDIEVVFVTRGSVSFIHRDHLRFSLPVRHCSVDLGTSTLSCVD